METPQPQQTATPEKTLHLIYSPEAIHEKVSQLAASIDASYPDGDLVILGCLNSAFMFTSDLVKLIKRKVIVDFIGFSSYSDNTVSDKISMTKDVKVNLTGKHIVVIEDCCDSGRTARVLLKYLAEKQPKSLEMNVLLGNPKLDYSTFGYKINYFWAMDGKWYVGYGMDNNEIDRNLPYIGYLE